MEFIDPEKFIRLGWPDVILYREQKQILYSVVENDETVVPAGNALGKDFISALIAIWFFASRSPCRVVTTSADHTQLEGVLWGEIRRFLQTSKIELPFVVNHLHIRQIINGVVDGRSYLIGRVAAKGEGMLGHHIPTADPVRDPRTLFISDESSGVDDLSYDRALTWSHRRLIIGNPFPCTNFFFRAVKGTPGTPDKGGDLPRSTGKGLLRKVIKIRAQDSPNVRLAEAEIRAGMEPSHTVLIPGVKLYSQYLEHRKWWDPIRQCVCLDAEFYEGSDVRLYPPEWLNAAVALGDSLPRRNKAKAMGVDPAEGGDNSAWAVVDDQGLVELFSIKTADTTQVIVHTIRLMKKYGVEPQDVLLDRGGGGKEHADQLREKGYPVRTVAFGETVKPELKRGMTPLEQKKEEQEEAYVYKNRRSEMAGLLRIRLNPALNSKGWGIPSKGATPEETQALSELYRQMSLIPLTYDGEGRLVLPPKTKLDPESKTKTLKEIIGNSPDEFDAVLLANYGLIYRGQRRTAGSIRVK